MSLTKFAAIVIAFGLASPANAVVKVARYAGKIVSGYDQNGRFGHPGGYLQGVRYFATFKYDTTLGLPLTYGLNDEGRIGGSAFGAVSPMIDSYITIHSITYHVNATYNGGAHTAFGVTGSGPSGPEVGHVSNDRSLINNIYTNDVIIYSGFLQFAPSLLSQNVSPIATHTGNGFIQFYSYDYNNNIVLDDTYADISSDAIYSVTDAVPEPASWALMIAGFGMIGTSLRRRSGTLHRAS